MAVEVEFVGHACFRIWQDGHPLVVTDPFTPSDVRLEDSGLRLDAEMVLLSSLTDLSHNNYGMVRGQPQVVNTLDVALGKTSASLNGEPIICIAASENYNRPDAPKENAIYAFKVGDLWFAHLGDLGYGLSAEALQPWKGHCDVLMPIVGDKYSLSLDELDPMIDILQPKYIFPMHYHLPPPGGPMQPVSKFLDRRPKDAILIANHHKIALPLPELKPGHPTIIILQPSGYSPNRPPVQFG